MFFFFSNTDWQINVNIHKRYISNIFFFNHALMYSQKRKPCLVLYLCIIHKIIRLVVKIKYYEDIILVDRLTIKTYIIQIRGFEYY